MLGNKIVAAVGPSNVIQGSLNQGNTLFGETPRIQCALWHYLQFRIQLSRK